MRRREIRASRGLSCFPRSPAPRARVGTALIATAAHYLSALTIDYSDVGIAKVRKRKACWTASGRDRTNSSDCRVIDFSPDGKFFYWSDDDDFVHSFSVDATTGAIAELAGSPYQNSSSTYVGGSGQVVVDVTGQFVYLADQDQTDGVLSFTRDMATGALTQIGTTSTPTANGAPQAVGIVR